MSNDQAQTTAEAIATRSVNWRVMRTDALQKVFDSQAAALGPRLAELEETCVADVAATPSGPTRNAQMRATREFCELEKNATVGALLVSATTVITTAISAYSSHRDNLVNATAKEKERRTRAKAMRNLKCQYAGGLTIPNIWELANYFKLRGDWPDGKWEKKDHDKLNGFYCRSALASMNLIVAKATGVIDLFTQLKIETPDIGGALSKALKLWWTQIKEQEMSA